MVKTLTRKKKVVSKKKVKKTVMKKKVTKTMKKKLVKKMTKKITMKLIKKTAKKPMKKSPVAKKTVKSAAVAGTLGSVVHYYDRIGVAILELTAPVVVGDLLTFRRGKREFTQPIGSMQMNHQPVERATKGQVVGVKVVQVTDPGTMVFPG